LAGRHFTCPTQHFTGFAFQINSIEEGNGGSSKRDFPMFSSSRATMALSERLIPRGKHNSLGTSHGMKMPKMFEEEVLLSSRNARERHRHFISLMAQSARFERLPEAVQIAGFTKLFEEKVENPVGDLREFCDSGEKLARLIDALSDIHEPWPTFKGVRAIRNNQQRQYALDLAVRPGFLTQPQAQNFCPASMDKAAPKSCAQSPRTSPNNHHEGET
jgi:hypothetical protein